MKKRISGLIITAALLSATAVQAATLAQWDNDNLVVPARSNAVNTVAADLSAGHLELGVGLAAPGVGNGAIPWDNALDAFIYTNATSLSSAIAAGHYYSFSVTPDLGKQVDYSNIFTRVTVNDSNSAGASLQVVLMSSATGFADGEELGSFVASTLADEITVTTNSFDVSGVAALQDQPSEVEFRLYIIANGGSYSRVAVGHIFSTEADPDDVRVDGMVEDATTLPIIKLASWDNDILKGTETNNAVSFVEAGMSAGDLAQSYRWFNDLAPWPNSMWALCSDLSAVTNLSESIASNRYFNITMEPDAGKQADYSKVSVRISLSSSGAWPGVGTSVKFVLMSSVTGFDDGDELGFFDAVHNPGDGAATDNGLMSMDISGVAELQDISDEVEFRVYVILNDTTSARWAIGHIFFNDNQDDMVVEGRVEDAPLIPATILSWNFVSDSVMKLVIDAPSASVLYYPKGSANLTLGFSGVAHSDNAGGPFVVTNLSYSAVEGDNKAIYVETTEVAKFFGLGDE